MPVLGNMAMKSIDGEPAPGHEGVLANGRHGVVDWQSSRRRQRAASGRRPHRSERIQVNELATGKPIEWFEKNLISTVPWRYTGAMRRVYPGVLQPTAFVSMNRGRHRQAFHDLYLHLQNGKHETLSATKPFYEEHFAVNDLPAEFHLETVAQVRQEYTLAKGELRVRGEHVDPAASRRIALARSSTA